MDNNFLKKAADLIKNNLNPQKDGTDLKAAFDEMDKELEEAEQAFGESFFPEDKKIPLDEQHLATLKLKKNATPEDIKAQFEKLRQKYNPENFKQDEKNFNAAKHITEKLNVSFDYLQKKFNNKDLG